MSKIELEFYLKRGVIDLESIDDDAIRQTILHVKSLVKNAEFDRAIGNLPPLFFEWVWSNGDGDPEDCFSDIEDISVVLSASNSRIRLGVTDDDLIISINVSFVVSLKDNVEKNEVQEWLDLNSMVYAGFVSGGWSYHNDEGSGVRVV